MNYLAQFTSQIQNHNRLLACVCLLGLHGLNASAQAQPGTPEVSAAAADSVQTASAPVVLASVPLSGLPEAASTAEAPYRLSTWGSDIKDTRWETAAVFAGITALGIKSWDWGSSKSFHVNSERWFGMDTSSGGADKLGHAFTSYALTNVLADRLVRQGKSPEQAALSAALTTQALMLYVEVFDGVSNDHGFSKEDLTMNLLGTTLAYARNVNPKLRDLVDYRMEYEPSGYKGFKPLSDYAGQKFLLAFKLGGVDRLRDTPLRYVELHAGYYARGFSKPEAALGFERSRKTFVGVGINLNELIFGQRAKRESELKNAGRLFFEHIQIPYSSATSSRSF